MRDGDWLIGWGTAATLHPSNIGPAAARVTLYPDGTAKVETAAHEIGTGIYTVCALAVAEKLSIDPEKVKVEIGDSDLPPAPVAGGSNSTASISNAIAKACDDILRQRAQGANGTIEAYAENLPKGVPENGLAKLHKGHVEVRVHALTREIRVPRARLRRGPSSIPRQRKASSWLA